MQQRKVLVVDDRREVMALCRRILSQSQLTVVAVGAGECRATAALERPDLVLLDLEDDGGRGWLLLRELSSGEDTRSIPLVALLQSGRDELARQALDMGVVDCIPKPVIPALLIKRVQTVLERYSGRVNRCGACFKPMQSDWSFCPYDGSRLAIRDHDQDHQ